MGSGGVALGAGEGLPGEVRLRGDEERRESDEDAQRFGADVSVGVDTCWLVKGVCAGVRGWWRNMRGKGGGRPPLCKFRGLLRSS